MPEEEDETTRCSIPAPCLTVLEALAKITGGVAVDPAGGHHPEAKSEQIMQAKEIKSGHIVNYNEAPCLIESINVQSPSARGAATFYKYRARNLITQAEGGHHAPRRRVAATRPTSASGPSSSCTPTPRTSTSSTRRTTTSTR